MRKLLRDRVAWPHPEWWVMSLSAAAWWSLALSAGVSAFDGEHGHATALSASPFLTGMREWLVMVAAMMFPLAAGAIQATAARSLWRRRHRAIACFLVGYISPWILLGTFASFLSDGLFTSLQLPRGPVIAGAFLIAAIWEMTTTRARAVSGCHQVRPLAPSGWRANRDCVLTGWAIGLNCVAACGPLMLACGLFGHGALGFTAMVTVSAIGFAERFTVRPDRGRLALAVAVHAIVAAVVVTA